MLVMPYINNVVNNIWSSDWCNGSSKLMRTCCYLGLSVNASFCIIEPQAELNKTVDSDFASNIFFAFSFPWLSKIVFILILVFGSLVSIRRQSKTTMGFCYGMNENQNHLIAEGRTTSRVLSVPGGKSSVQLGWDSPKNSSKSPLGALKWCKSNTRSFYCAHSSDSEPTTAIVSQKEKKNIMKVIGATAPTVKFEANEAKQQSAVRAGNSGISSNAYAQGSRQNVGNVITDRPSSRVTQPPGGRSSISFYWLMVTASPIIVHSSIYGPWTVDLGSWAYEHLQ